jgi:hypothetical protein
MPPKRTISGPDPSNQEGRILLAIQAYRNNEITSIREAARRFGVPRTTLRHRLAGQTYRPTTRANNTKLTQLEEESLKTWLLSMDDRGIAADHALIREMANILLAKRGEDPIQTVGVNWSGTFIKRHEDLTMRFSRGYDYKRAQCEDPVVIRDWFSAVRRTIEQYGILPTDIYNFDETGFAMGITSTSKVVTRREYYGRRKVVRPGNREWVTAIETVNASGWALPPTIIFKGKRYNQSWFVDLPSDWRLETSDNGWTTDEIGLRWLKHHFIPLTTQRTQGVWRLLILDGHGSHLTAAFDDICIENNIVSICMPPHSSHLLQPLDVGCFAVIKRSYGQLIQDWIRWGRHHIDKLDFLAAYPHARDEAYKAITIQNSFAAAGLVPLDAQRVLDKLNISLADIYTPTPPGTSGSDSSSFVLHTPHHPKDLSRQANSINRLLRQRMHSPPSPIVQAFSQLLKGYEREMHKNAISEREIEKLRAQVNQTKQKQAKPSKWMDSEEGMTGEDNLQRMVDDQLGVDVENTGEAGQSLAANPTNKRAPPRCSNCWQIGHRRTKCPN